MVRYDRTPIVFRRNGDTITAFPCNQEHRDLFRAGQIVMCTDCRVTVETVEDEQWP